METQSKAFERSFSKTLNVKPYSKFASIFQVVLINYVWIEGLESIPSKHPDSCMKMKLSETFDRLGSMLRCKYLVFSVRSFFLNIGVTKST